MTVERIGPYRVEHRLGGGGMGLVYSAWDERLERRVALKQLRPERGDDPARRQQLRREARMSARLDHPAIVQVYDLLESADGDWIVMQYVAGPTLAQRLREHGRLSSPQVIAIGRDVLGALEHAHRRGMLHRDLKTENVMLAPDGRAMVLDFGLAKLVDPPPGLASAHTGAIVGTYRSMSPEQANGFALDARSDLFSLGVLLYEIATGRSPFHGESPVDTMSRVCTLQQPPAHEVEPAVSATLSAFIDSLLEKEPARRPASAGEALSRLEAAAGGWTPPTAPVEEPTLDALGRPARPVRPAALPAASPEVTSSSYRPLWRVPAALAGIALLAIAGGVLWTTTRARAPKAPIYVVAARTELGADAVDAAEQPRLAAATLDAAVLRSLAALAGVIAVPGGAPEKGAPPPTAKRLATLHAADEVLTSSLDCAARRCVAALRRLRGSDGQLVSVQSFEVPVDDLHLLATAADTYVRACYAGFPIRGGTAPVRVRGEDYLRFLRLQRQWEEKQPPDVMPLIGELTAIRNGSPLFVDAYLLEARLWGRRFFNTRDAADLDHAIALLQQAKALAPNDPEPVAALFRVALPARRLDEAAAAASELERLVPGDARGVYRRAMLAESRGDGRRGLAMMREAVDRHPSADLTIDLANMEIRQGEVTAARATLEGLLRRLPDHFAAERLLAQVELESGSPARAAELYGDLVRRHRGFAELSNLGVAQLLLGRPGAAATSFEEAAAMAPKSAPAALNLADARQLAGERAAARALYEHVLELVAEDPAPDFWQTLSVRAQALAHLGRARDAAAAIERAKAQAPDNPQLAYEAALVHALSGEDAAAVASADRALAGGFDRRWFAFPWFDGLRRDPRFAAELAAPAASPSPSTTASPSAGR